MWDETLKSHTDSKPNRPESVDLDISFNDFQHVWYPTTRRCLLTKTHNVVNLEIFN